MSTKELQISEKENQLIEVVAQKIVNSDFEGPVLTLLELVKPLVFIGGELAYFYLAVFLPLLENHGYDFLDTFEKRENVEKLITRIEELNEKKEGEKKINQGSSLFSKLKNKFTYKYKLKNEEK